MNFIYRDFNRPFNLINERFYPNISSPNKNYVLKTVIQILCKNKYDGIETPPLSSCFTSISEKMDTFLLDEKICNKGEIVLFQNKWTENFKIDCKELDQSLRYNREDLKIVYRHKTNHLDIDSNLIVGYLNNFDDWKLNFNLLQLINIIETHCISSIFENV